MADATRVALMCLLLQTGCASPAERFEERALTSGLVPERIKGKGFVHSLFIKRGEEAGAGDRLHVYISGDGTPMVAGLPADDPTPRAPLILDLIAADPGRAVLLGRPCYHGDGPRSACEAALWTSARYGERAVESMAAALRRFMASRRVGTIVWFGYSGGGALAVLLAARFAETAALVTVAANRDVAAWRAHHRQPALVTSLDPAAGRPLPPGIVQRHYVGSEDVVVPPATLRRVLSWPGWIEVPGFDHRCCWAAVWPQIVTEALDATGPARPDHRSKLIPTETK